MPVTKNEQFEMWFDKDTLDRVDKWRAAQRNHPSRAEAIWRLVDIGLSKETKSSVDFTDGEKLLILMMGDLYKHLKVNGKIDPVFMREAITGGHTWALNREMDWLFHDCVDKPENVSFVENVLDMWSFVEQGYNKLSREEQARVKQEVKLVKFPGFDEKNERDCLSIAKFLIEQMGRFQSFKGRELNSHCQLLTRYRRMLQIFKPIRAMLIERSLNTDELIAILKA